jgi:hypothetical protein
MRAIAAPAGLASIPAREQRAILWVFAGTLFLSALLLFSVQPIFAKLVLPKLGGAPSVWAVSMVFFQAMLLAGYCYAHVLNARAPARRARIIHLCLLGAALPALPFGLPPWGSEPPAGDAYLWLIGVLAAGVGLPFLAVSATAPLLQSWFARSGHPHASDPYFLYGASNLGSLSALLAYPVAIEPVLGLGLQAQVWTAGFCGLGLLIAACAVVRSAEIDRTSAAPAAAAVTARQRLLWVGLAAVPSGLLVAFTSYLTTDIASAPFLWVIPLAVFLATFILVFRDRPAIPHRILLLVQPVLVAQALLGLSLPGNRGWMLATLFGFGAFFVTTMVCHKELYDQRPEPGRLTEFYLWMSLGGVIGGVFAALAAPQLFNAIWEYPLLLIAGLACRSDVRAALARKAEAQDAGMTGFFMATILLAFLAAITAGSVPQFVASSAAAIAILVLAVFAIASMRQPLHGLALAAVMGLALVVLPSAMSNGFSERSFFGVHRVTTTGDGSMRLLLHGTTVHGAQRILDASGQPVAAPLPATYYYPGSPMARGVEMARRLTGKTAGGLRVGSVGLGAGSLACYSRPSESWRFFEIDPLVVKLASDPKLFNFLSRCRPDADVVLGDARLTLAREPAGGFDYLVIDAFSSDSVPVHLLTREALALYLDKLAPNGLLALHVSNRHLDLVSVAGAVALSVPGAHAALADDRPEDKGFDAAASHVVLISKSEAALAPLLEWPDVTAIETSAVAPWTDDFSDILGAIVRNYRQK